MDPYKVIAIWRCCRDWPVNPLAKMGRCGYCGEVPEPTSKTVAEYLTERDWPNRTQTF